MLEILCKNKYVAIGIRKLNILPAQRTDDRIPAICLLNETLSKALRRFDLGQNALEKEAKSYFSECVFKHEGGVLSLKYGFDTIKEDESKLFMVLDTRYRLDETVKQKDSVLWLKKANDVLFDVFHWSVNQDVLDKMDAK